MRTAALAAVLALAAGLALAAPPATPAASGKPGASPAASATASPVAKPKDPERNGCTGVSKDGSYSATASDYQACLREITNAVKAKSCADGVKEVDFVFHRFGQKPMATRAVCN